MRYNCYVRFLKGFVSFLGMDASIFRQIRQTRLFFIRREPSLTCLKYNWLAYNFQKRQLMPYYGVSHWGVARDESGEIDPKNVDIMCFNGPGIAWGGETMCVIILPFFYERRCQSFWTNSWDLARLNTESWSCWIAYFYFSFFEAGIANQLQVPNHIGIYNK